MERRYAYIIAYIIIFIYLRGENATLINISEVGSAKESAYDGCCFVDHQKSRTQCIIARLGIWFQDRVVISHILEENGIPDCFGDFLVSRPCA